MSLKLSLLDQSPIFEGETPTEALAHTIELARWAERLGYYRFWVSEHHDSSQVVGTSPEVLIAHLLAKTETIRIGSGGVMLQHYSPFKVAENFNVLAALAPGRVDLGIGRAPGGLPHSTRALQGEGAAPRPLAEKLAELDQYLHNRLEESHPLYGVRANPVVPKPADLHLLGTTAESGKLAGEFGVPYVFALFINGDEDVAEEAIRAYRERFRPVRSAAPEPIVAVSVVVAETEEAARRIASDFQLVKIHLESGRTITVSSLQHAQEIGRQTAERYTFEVKDANIIAGTKETVRRKLLSLQERFGIGETILTAPARDFADRVRSIRLLREAFSEASVDG
jgi:luciferase family oxidoreductase group 1